MNKQYIGRLVRPRHPRTWGVTIAVTLLAAAGCAVAALLTHLYLLLVGVGVSLMALGLISYLLLREMCWCELYPDCIIIQNPFGEVTSLSLSELEAVSIHRFGKEEWYILWDGRPLRYGLYGRGKQNNHRVAVRLPVGAELDAFLFRIPIPEEKQTDRDLLREALEHPEATFLWRDTVYELTACEDGHLTLWLEDEEDSTLLGRYQNMEDFIKRGTLHNTPVSALLAPSKTFRQSETLREDVVKASIRVAVDTFRMDPTLVSLTEIASVSGYRVRVEGYFFRPSPTISYEGGISIDVVDREGNPLLVNEEPLSYDIPCVVADEIGHLDLYPWQENEELSVAMAVMKQILLMRTPK